MPWSSGVVEGHVNRIKMLKRQMFGRASFHLLRKRVLLAIGEVVQGLEPQGLAVEREHGP
ncbi:hypothetical protein DLE01_25600 [Streptomyces sp. FT05W]|nr:hypothetical protein DLE01_25600 [Streptomyces sp. FT05W]